MNNDLSEQNIDEIELLDLVGVLFKHKLLISFFTTIVMLGIVIFAILSTLLPTEISPLPNVYKSISTVRINDSNSGSGLSSMLDSSGLSSIGGLLGVNAGSGVNESAFAIKLATSNTITDQIFKEFDLIKVYELEDSKYPITGLREQIKKSLSFNEDSDSGTISISYEDIDRDLATKIVNRVVDILEQKYAELDQTSINSQQLILEDKISDVEQEISLLQQQIFNFQNKYDILDTQTLAQVIGEKLVTLRISLVEKDAAIATYRSKSRIEDPALIKLKDERKALENSLWALEHGTIDGVPALIDLPLIVLEYEKLTRNLQVQATIYTTLRQQLELLKLQNGGSGPKFQIIEYAEVPEMKSGPNRGKICIIVTFIAFFLSIFLAFFKEFWDNLKNDPERIKKLKGLS